MDRLPSFEDVARELEDNETRDILRYGQFAGKVARYQGKWYVGGPRIPRDTNVALAISLTPDIYNKREPNHLKHYYKCESVEDAVRTYEGLLAYEE